MNGKKKEEEYTHAAFAECPGVGRRCEIEPPRIVGDGILPVDETFGSLSDARACYHKANQSDDIKRIPYCGRRSSSPVFFRFLVMDGRTEGKTRSKVGRVCLRLCAAKYKQEERRLESVQQLKGGQRLLLSRLVQKQLLLLLLLLGRALVFSGRIEGCFIWRKKRRSCSLPSLPSFPLLLAHFIVWND